MVSREEKENQMTRAICYYVSGHGLGHASRAVQVMQCLPANQRLIIKSTAPAIFFRREIKRPFDFVPERFDTGAWQQSNFGINWQMTFEEAIRVQGESLSRLAQEIAFLKRERVGLVVTDVAPMPLRAAREAGIPGITVVNFTWPDIFESEAKGHPAREQLVQNYLDDYKCASLALRTSMSFSMRYFPRLRDIPLIARSGTSCRSTLVKELAIPKTNRIVLLYFGNWGNGSMRLERLDSMRGVSFVAFSKLDSTVNYLDPDRWAFEDVVASVDAVLAKPGYGTMGECMANGTPTIYYPRREFREYWMLRRSLDQWGGALRLTRRELLECRWKNALEEAFTLRPAKVDHSGARVASNILCEMF